uniref:Uncharacterized protein n=1 Tax=Arundo donax TaxID=35708 RepID=A0A0A9HCG2_ARUDO
MIFSCNATRKYPNSLMQVIQKSFELFKGKPVQQKNEHPVIAQLCSLTKETPFFIWPSLSLLNLLYTNTASNAE